MTAQALATKFKNASQVQINDTTRRFGYSAGVPNLTCPPKYSGLPAKEVPGGQLITFAPEMESTVGPYNEQKKIYPIIKRQITPAEQVKYVASKFQFGTDAGFRELTSLVKLPYEVQGDEYFDAGPLYFAVVHPKIECEFGLESDFISRAEGNVGATWYQACPTCRLKSLESDEVNSRIINSTLDKDVLFKLRQQLIDACRAGIIFAETQISRVDADLERRMRGEHGRTYRYEVDLIYLKMVHRDVPQPAKQLSPQEIVTQAASAAAAGVMTAMQSTAPVAEAPQQDAIVLTGDDKAAYEQWQAKKAQLAQARAAKEEKNGTGSHDPAGNEGDA